MEVSELLTLLDTLPRRVCHCLVVLDGFSDKWAEASIPVAKQAEIKRRRRLIIDH